jgi:hypothetical protein
MINTFKNNHFLAVISSMLAAILLWMGLSFVPSYAESTHTYYAFVMHKTAGGWSHSTKPVSELQAGSYRFQIVYVKPDRNWIALRGEFKFVEDTKKGGVEILSRNTLTENSTPNGDTNSSLWDDQHSDRNKHWINAGRPLVQPLIAKMRKKLNSGNPDPNFMRFLVRRPKIKESWSVGGTDYHLYRFHYIDTNSVYNYVEPLSRFINPAENFTSLAQLKEWINDQSDFGIAKYLGTADEAHREFYSQFKDWFNQKVGVDDKQPADDAQDNTGNGTETSPEEENSNLSSNPFVILFMIVIILIMVIWIYKQPDSDHKAGSSRNNHDSDPYDTTTDGTISYQKISFLKKFDLKKVLRFFHNISQGINRGNGKENVNIPQTSELPPYLIPEVKDVLKDTPIIEKDKAVSQILSSPEFRRILSEEIQKFLQEVSSPKFRNIFSEEVQKFLQRDMSRGIEEIVKRQMYASTLGNKEFMNTLTTKVGSYIEKRIEEPQHSVAAPTPRATSLGGNSRRQKREPEVKESPQPVSPSVNKVTEQLKNIFVSMKSIDDETGLNASGVNVEPCDFVIQVVGNYLKLNQPVAYYERLDQAIQNLTDKKVSLIIPNVGDDVDSAEHNVLSQQTVTKGKLNVVASLARPGVKCDDAIRRKAEVVQNI